MSKGGASRLGLLWWLLIIPFSSLFGQSDWKKTLHQTYEVPDSVCLVEIEIPWAYEVEIWPTNAMMSEQNLELHLVTEPIAKNLVQQGRYTMKLNCKFGVCVLTPLQPTFPVIRTAAGDLEERVRVRIFLPDDFEKAGDHLWTRMWKP